jgi:SAM-dependent methyltransferase
MTTKADIEGQATYHAELFTHLSHWDEVWKTAIDMLGDHESALALGLDHLGLFGPRGVSLVIERLVANTVGAQLSCVVELGSGFGGALRHAERDLRSRGLQPRLIGIEIVRRHCELARTIGRALDDDTPVVLQADAGNLPIHSTSIDAVFAVGSASHFSSVSDVVRECHRVLRPDGIFVMIEEVSLQPRGARPLGEAFLAYHPYVRTAGVEERRSQIETAGFRIVEFESLAAWAEGLLHQRAQAMRFLAGCAHRIYGVDASERIIDTLTSAARECGRGSIQPTLIVARRLYD